MGRVLIASILLLFASFAGAASISAPGSVPANVVWGFSIDLEGASNLAVKVDDALLVQIGSDGTVTRGKFNNEFLWGPGSNTIYVSHFGLEQGDHAISVESDSGNDSKEVSAFVPLDSSFANRIESEVNSRVDAKLNSVDQLFKNIEADNKEFFRRINENDSRIGSLDGKISGVDSELSGLKSGLGDLSSSGASLSSRVSGVDERLKVLEGTLAEEEAARLAREEELRNSPIGGLFTLASDYAIPIALIVIVVVIGIAAFLAKDRILGEGPGIYTKTDENNLPVSDSEEAAEELLDAKPGKWSFK